jgi:hypothetical protein
MVEEGFRFQSAKKGFESTRSVVLEKLAVSGANTIVNFTDSDRVHPRVRPKESLPTHFSGTKNRAEGGLRPPPGGGLLRVAPKSQRVIVVERRNSCRQREEIVDAGHLQASGLSTGL